MHNPISRRQEENCYVQISLCASNTRDVLPTCPPGSPGEGIDCWPPPEYPFNVNHDELGNPGLSPDEEAAIVTFLRTLSDGYPGK